MGSCLNVQLSQVKIQKLFVGNLPPDAKPDDIQRLFEAHGAKVVNAESCEGKRFGFVRVENDRGYHAINQLVKTLHHSSYMGKKIFVELSEDLSKEQKAQRRAEQAEQADSAYDEWENTPVELRAAPGFHGMLPNMDHGRGGMRGRGRGGGRGSATMRSDYSGDGFWPQGSHSNKMPSRGGFGGLGRGGPGGPGRGGPGGLLALTGPGARGRGGPGLGKPFPYPMPGPGSDLALEFGGGYEPSREDDSRMNSGTEDGKKLLNEYYSMMFESYTRYQTQLFETGQFSDFTIQCEGTEFKVHRLVLGPKSPVLMKVMSDTPSPMLIRDVDTGTLQILLNFMYSGRVDVDGINPAKIMKLLTAADLYQVEHVREGLEATLMENIEEDTAVDYLIFSEELQLSNLRLEVGKYICKHSRQFKARPDFRKLSQYPHLVMELFDHASYF